MKVISTELMISAVRPEQYPDGGRPEIALAGRSNVGKSSLINQLINRKSLARTSQTPGKTQTLNFYLVNQSFIFVDVPGYGYARAPKREQEKWGEMVETYLQNRKLLKAVILIIDVRHPPGKNDVLMVQWLKHFHLPIIIVATKADKIKKSGYNAHLAVIREKLELEKDDSLILFSSKTALGKSQVWGEINTFL